VVYGKPEVCWIVSYKPTRNTSDWRIIREKKGWQTLITESQVEEALAQVMDPELGRNLVELGMIRDVEIKDSGVKFTLSLTTLACPFQDQLVSQAKAAVVALDGMEKVEIELAEMSSEEREQALSKAQPAQQASSPLAQKLNDVKHVIAVMSGKGGVGKSLVSSLLAVALHREGQEVGVLDADITGPSIPKMFGIHSPPVANPLGILPVKSSLGTRIMSINLLLPSEDDAVVWRGPLISGAIKQFWEEVIWGKLDTLVVDLPPGTSDASLTVMQSMPLSGVVLVTSPQDLAGMVVRKAAKMAQHLDIAILGLVENMSYFVAPDTGKRYDIFGPSHARETATQVGVPFLGQLPLDPRIAELSDAGRIEEYAAEVFIPIAQTLIERAPAAKHPPPLNS
jgi:Mrp family chromosome partitioning ATPase